MLYIMKRNKVTRADALSFFLLIAFVITLYIQFKSTNKHNVIWVSSTLVFIYITHIINYLFIQKLSFKTLLVNKFFLPTFVIASIVLIKTPQINDNPSLLQFAVITFISIIFIYGVYMLWANRDQSFSLIKTITNLSREALIFIIVGVFVILVLYTYAQCQAFNTPWSIDCAISTFGKW